MLIEFKVSNFKSIREEQTLSLVASNADKSLPGNVIDRSLPGLKNLKYLTGAALYGANASGKSNVLEALVFLGNFVTNSATKIQPNEPTGTIPFKLDDESRSKPSTFEITFVAAGIRYLFGLSLTESVVTEEYLVAYPKGLPQRWYRRKLDAQTHSYLWDPPSSAFKQDEDLQVRTRDNSLYLSVGPQFNHPQLNPVFEWFKFHLRWMDLSAESRFAPGHTAMLVNKGHSTKEVVQLLRSADIGVVDVEVEQRVEQQRLNQRLEKLVPSDLFERLRPDLMERDLTVAFTHQATDTTSVALDFEKEESAGTRRFFSLIGPWVDILENGYTVCIDEIETSLHPLLVRDLLRLVFSAEHNPKGAQVIFTTHNPILLDNALMRRDQVWFTEKTPDGATHLYPLTDYKPRKDEALAKGYLAGRYGAIPYLPEGLRL